MGQSGPGNSPEIGRPRGAVWRTLVSEGIAWEGQVTIAGEHSDLDARLIVTGQRVVFIRNGAIALDAERDWLDPAPTIGRNGRVLLAISTPNGNGPIPVEIRVRDGKFGATRLLARLNDRPGAGASPFSTPPPRVNGRREAERNTASTSTGTSPARRSSGMATSRPATRPVPPAVPIEPPAASHFGIPPSGLPPTASPMPSFGVSIPPAAKNRPGHTGVFRPSPSATEPAPTATEPAPALSVAAVREAFGTYPGGSVTGERPVTGLSQALPENPTRWTLASELLARSGPATETPLSPSPPAAAGTAAPAEAAKIPAAAMAPVARPEATGPGPNARPGGPLALSSGSSASMASVQASSGREIPSSLRVSDPVSHARSTETVGTRSMLPGLPSGQLAADPASNRRPVSAAPSGRLAGNSVITARSSAAARQSAKQGGGAPRPDELSPSAVALASARAGVPLAPTPGPVPVSDIPVLADGSGDATGRGGFFSRFGGGRVGARAAWSVTAIALLALTVAAGLYLAFGIPTDDGGDGDRTAGLTQPAASDGGQVAIVAATPSASTRIIPTPTATNAIPRGVGGESNAVTIPTRPATAPVDGDDSGDGSSEPPADAPSASADDGGSDGVDITATDDVTVDVAGIVPGSPSPSPSASVIPSPSTEPSASAVPSVAPSPSPSPEPSVAPTATATATEAPTAEPTATDAPSATVAPSDAPTATTPSEPTATTEPTATDEPTVEPTATVRPTATTGPTATIGPDVEPQPATVEDDGVPSQVFVVGSVRYTIESVEAGATIPEINQPESPFGGDWLAAVLTAENWGDGDAVIDMTQFTASIASSGETRPLDSYSEVVALRLGFPEVVGASQQVTVAPGDSIRLGLLFLTAQNASGFVLNAGTATVDLTAAFNSSLPMNELGDPPTAPDLLEATVVGVIDAVTIEVEIDGEKIPVRYTGTAAPDIDSCFSGSSTVANRDLVMGQTVWLERQNANVDSDGTWLRDVWIESDSGSLELVSSVLVTAGEIDATVERPNSRYAAYLETLAFIAETNGTGIWAGCGS